MMLTTTITVDAIVSIKIVSMLPASLNYCHPTVRLQLLQR
eukprot:CAMPEP_0119560622 /NCGR_PEP_ID=MMETSP1352-20130426/15443_1 /TAXON_ID=265584 /ORGANISM="Stauroneis constricta, Strain CCMP1120" /LENGTH=39 /DNA_ID= /DNA_START= /DNA_END= /DNA_ORIENTATION=